MGFPLSVQQQRDTHNEKVGERPCGQERFLSRVPDIQVSAAVEQFRGPQRPPPTRLTLFSFIQLPLQQGPLGASHAPGAALEAAAPMETLKSVDPRVFVPAARPALRAALTCGGTHACPHAGITGTHAQGPLPLAEE